MATCKDDMHPSLCKKQKLSSRNVPLFTKQNVNITLRFCHLFL